MNKKTLIITSITIGLIIVGVVLYFALRPSDTDDGKPSSEGFFSFIFPSGDNKPLPTPTPPLTGTGSTPGTTGTTSPPTRRLIQITDFPIAGATFNEENQKVRYFEKSTGHVYEINPQGLEKEQVSITTIPKIFEVVWSRNATNTILRYTESDNGSLEIARTFLAEITASTTEGVFLPSSTVSTVMSPSEDKVFYLLENGTAQGITASFENKSQKEIFSLPFSEFLTDWPQKNIITLLTKPSYSTKGYLYKINPSTGYLTKLLGGIKGLTVKHSPNNEDIIYGQSENKSITTKIYNTSNQETKFLGASTFPEKCIFSKLEEEIVYCSVPRTIPSGNYPDEWYQGLVSFSDSIWKINTSSGSTELLINQESFDAVNLFLNETEDYLFFQNKKDSTLWSLRLKS